MLPFYMIEGSQSLMEFLFEMVVPRRMILGQKEKLEKPLEVI